MCQFDCDRLTYAYALLCVLFVLPLAVCAAGAILERRK